MTAQGADDEALTRRRGWLSRSWGKIATILAVINLVDVTGRMIKWTPLIRSITENYAAARDWLFDWLPFNISPEWYDPIVLLLIFISMANIGVGQRGRHTFIYFWPLLIWRAVTQDGPRLVFIGFVSNIYLAILMNTTVTPDAVLDFGVDLFISLLLFSAFIVIFWLLSLASLAWRWVLGTASIFAGLTIINEISL